MLQISTKQDLKLVEVDGFAYKIRRPGAGESLTMQRSGRELKRLGELKDMSEKQTEQLQDITMNLLSICLDLFKGQDEKATAYLQTLDAEVLLDVVNQVFDLNGETVS